MKLDNDAVAGNKEDIINEESYNEKSNKLFNGRDKEYDANANEKESSDEDADGEESDNEDADGEESGNKEHNEDTDGEYSGK